MSDVDPETAVRVLATWADGGHPGPWSVSDCARVVLSELASRDATISRLEGEAFSDRIDIDAGGDPLTWKEVAERSERQWREMKARAQKAEADAQAWRGLVQTICTVLDLGELDYDQIAGAVRAKFAKAQEALGEAVKVVEPFSDACDMFRFAPPRVRWETEAGGLVYAVDREGYKTEKFTYRTLSAKALEAARTFLSKQEGGK